MAAMDQGKLDNMVEAINTGATNYVDNVETAVTTIKSNFNENWVSSASQALATEIKDCLDSLATAITDTFSNMNNSIKIAISNFNTVEQEDISYSGFSFGKPNIDITLNDKLPSGKVGVAEGAELNTIGTAMDSLVDSVSTALKDINTVVSGADAFSSSEQEALTSKVASIESTFKTSMGGLKESLYDRMKGEISARDSLNAANVNVLSGGSEQ